MKNTKKEKLISVDNHSNTQASTPDYIRRNIYKYQKVNKRATIYISKEHVELYKRDMEQIYHLMAILRC